MRYFANYRFAAEKATEVLEDVEITEAPINLAVVLERYSNEIRFVTYSKFMRASGRSLGDVISFFDSDMGACAFEPLTNRFIIYYNDNLSANWIRFTIAHELGHIFLEHHQKAGTDILGRTFVPKDDYEEYEKEANVFARNLLAPAPLAKEIISGEDEDDAKLSDLRNAFSITESAAKMRLLYLKRDLLDYSPEMKTALRRIRMTYNPLYDSLERQMTQKGIAEEDIRLTIETVKRLKGDDKK